MRLTKTRANGGYVRFTLEAKREDGISLTDTVIEAARWIDKHKPGTQECRSNIANCLRSMRAQLRIRLNTMEVENV